MLQSLISVPVNIYHSVKSVPSDVKGLYVDWSKVDLKVTEDQKLTLKEKAYGIGLRILGGALLTGAAVSLGFTIIAGVEVASTCWLVISVVSDFFLFFIGHDFCLIGIHYKNREVRERGAGGGVELFPDIEAIVREWLKHNEKMLQGTVLIGPVTVNVHTFAASSGLYTSVRNIIRYLQGHIGFFNLLANLN